MRLYNRVQNFRRLFYSILAGWKFKHCVIPRPSWGSSGAKTGGVLAFSRFGHRERNVRIARIFSSLLPKVFSLLPNVFLSSWRRVPSHFRFTLAVRKRTAWRVTGFVSVKRPAIVTE